MKQASPGSLEAGHFASASVCRKHLFAVHARLSPLARAHRALSFAIATLVTSVTLAQGGDLAMPPRLVVVPSASAKIVMARATRTEAGGLRVAGSVHRLGLSEPPPGSHVDIHFIGRNGKVLNRTAINYVPRQIPHPSRGQSGSARFSEHVAPFSAAVAAIHIRFHALGISTCRGDHTTTSPR